MKILRLRLFNFRLFGNLRKGLYKECSLEEIAEFIQDFHAFCCQKKASASDESKANLSNVNVTDSAVTDIPDFGILERLCEQYYVHEGTEKFQKKILMEVRDIVEELRYDPKTAERLEQWLNDTQDGVVSKLKSSHPELKKDDIKLFCFLQAGFTPTMISVLLQKEKSVVYNRVSRLKAKIR